ncbi:MAG: family 10 glycosylhydrolase [Oscillospiraceae bacterium]|nr:family 10 glycosylhydrolase [Oscillospiraceae bacterium]
MKRIFTCLAAVLVLLCGCGTEESVPEPEYYIQEAAHLYLDAELPKKDAVQESGDTVLNYERVHAVWIPVMQYGDWMTGKTETEFRNAVREGFGKCAEFGINTVYVHVRAYGDAYYHSDLFPAGSYLDGDYDPLAIMTEEAHARELSIHAWINPMRTASADRLAREDAGVLGEWYRDGEKNGTFLVQSGSLYYLNPAYREVRQLIAEGVSEIVTQYDVDGVHIDDFFYPTQDAGFDAAAFAASGAADLGEWRRENCSAMVREMYGAVKEKDSALLFGISPQGNMGTNHDKLYADTERWCSEEGFCDYIVPQIYYGFANSTCPFAETARLWAETASAAKLIIGLAPYKIGLTDQWAGAGTQEWCTDPEVLSAQEAFCASLEQVSGTAFYSYASLFAPEETVAVMVQAEAERIREGWEKQ